MMQRFTDDAQKVLTLAQEAALELGLTKVKIV